MCWENVHRQCQTVRHEHQMKQISLATMAYNYLRLTTAHKHPPPIIQDQETKQNVSYRYFVARSLSFTSHISQSLAWTDLKKNSFSGGEAVFRFRNNFLHSYKYLISIYGIMFLLAAHINSLVCLQSWRTKD